MSSTTAFTLYPLALADLVEYAFESRRFHPSTDGAENLHDCDKLPIRENSNEGRFHPMGIGRDSHRSPASPIVAATIPHR